MKRSPAGFAAFVLACLMCVLAHGAEKPNVVYILCDDLGYGDLGCQNPKSKIPTPRLDKMAADGIRFSDAHDPTSVCTPTRYGILTGRYCWRSALKIGVLAGYSPALLEPGRLTVASMLKEQGYATACIGKWHLGMSWPKKDGGFATEYDQEEQVDFAQPIQDGPTTRGFDYYFGISASLDMPPYVFIENDRTIVVPTEHQPALKGRFVRAGRKDPAVPLDQFLPKLSERAVKYIGERAEKSKEPFFLYLPLPSPHTPLVPAKEFKGKSQAGDYGDYVFEVDWVVGQVLDALAQKKLADNTLVILTSDNGPERIAYARAEEFRHFSMGDLRGVKRDTWEGGHRVPFLAQWPGHIKPGSVSNEVICQTDFMATVAGLVGAKLPNDAAEDSYNILPAILGETLAKPIREATVHHSSTGVFAIRQGNWVFIDGKTGDDNGKGGEPDWLKKERGYQPHHFPGELYDLSSDLAEHNNLYGEKPEKVKELKALLEKYKQEGRSVPKR